MGKAQSRVIDTIRVKLTFMPHGEMRPRVVECNFWQWAGPEETAVDVFRVYGGRLVRAVGYNNVAAVEEI